MTRDEVLDSLREALGEVAPEGDPRTLGVGEDLRDALDLDSMDFLRFMQEVSARLAVEVPERDYGRLRTLADCADYVAPRIP